MHVIRIYLRWNTQEIKTFMTQSQRTCIVFMRIGSVFVGSVCIFVDILGLERTHVQVSVLVFLFAFRCHFFVLLILDIFERDRGVRVLGYSGGGDGERSHDGGSGRSDSHQGALRVPHVFVLRARLAGYNTRRMCRDRERTNSRVQSSGRKAIRHGKGIIRRPVRIVGNPARQITDTFVDGVWSKSVANHIRLHKKYPFVFSPAGKKQCFDTRQVQNFCFCLLPIVLPRDK